MAKLFYIIGGSGAGKDSLINYVRSHISDNFEIEFVRRYITRSSNAGGENHIELTEGEFLKYKDKNHFVMDWFSHNTYYGISSGMNVWLSNNISVVMNGSRSYLGEAATRYPDIIPVLIRVDPLILSERLLSRGRESYSEIQNRIAQAIKLESSVQHRNLMIIDNNASLSYAGEKLLNILTHGFDGDKCV